MKKKPKRIMPLNRYRVITEHDVEKRVWAYSMKEVREDFEKAMPGVKLLRITRID